MALPGDAGAERLARGALPGQHGFALVGDRQGSDLPGGTSSKTWATAASDVRQSSQASCSTQAGWG